MFIQGIEGLFDHIHNVCVVGAGPVGIVVALELARLGQSVTLLESGSMATDKDAQRLSEAILVDPRRNADMSVAVQRRFGGTSNVWGGGCVPLDPIDFEPHPIVSDARWPISYDEFAAHVPDACRYANCGVGCFEDPMPEFGSVDTRFRTDHLMRYADPPCFRRSYGAAIASSSSIQVFLGATLTGFHFAEDGRVEGLIVKSLGGAGGVLRAKTVILACGGVETTRLLLASQAASPARFGGEAGPLGRYYMGHLSGAIADVCIHSEALDESLDFYLENGRSYARRRFTAGPELQRRHSLTNIALWPTPPPMNDSAHRDAVLSLAYLVLSIPPLGRFVVSEALRRMNVGDGGGKIPHLLNVAVGLPTIAGFLPRFLYGRFLARRRLPGLHLRNRARLYSLHYHAEHLPDPESRIRLTAGRDALGLRRVALDLRFSAITADPIVRTHEHLSQWLSETGLGELYWHRSPEERVMDVLDQASDGVHQIGSARMADSPRRGVVDRDCRVFSSNNLFLAGSVVFPTSGQANPTLTAIALGIRQARLIAREVSSRAPAASKGPCGKLSASL